MIAARNGTVLRPFRPGSDPAEQSHSQLPKGVFGK